MEDRLTIPSDADRATLAELRTSHEGGASLAAYRRGLDAFGPLPSWPGAEGLVLAARLAHTLGAFRVGYALSYRAGRADPGGITSQLYAGYALLNRRGPLAAWDHVHRRDADLSGTPQERSRWATLAARILICLRDFEGATAWLDRAHQTLPDEAGQVLARASLLRRQERWVEALDQARRAAALDPCLRGGAFAVAQLQLDLGRPDEAAATLADATRRVDDAALQSLWTTLLLDRGQADDAALALDRLAALTPLSDKGSAQRLAALRADLAWLRGDRTATIAQANEAGGPFWTAVAGHLAAAPEEPQRVLLPVPPVRQFHDTCAPATLAALLAYWDQPGQHETIVAAICYAGTSGRAERAWLEEHGWHVREASLDESAARALLDRGVPFALGLRTAFAGHLVAVVGYDSARGTLLVRDPASAFLSEHVSARLGEQPTVRQTRALIVLPDHARDRLDGLELPNAALHDGCFAVEQAIDRGDLVTATAEADALAADAPDHPLALEALRSVAIARDDSPAIRSLNHRLLEVAPGSPSFHGSQLVCLRDGAARATRLEFIEAYRDEGRLPPRLRLERARELARDGRTAAHAEREATVLARQVPENPEPLGELADHAWRRRENDRALQLYRYAVLLGWTHEGLARSWFRAARFAGQAERAVELLRRRFDDLGDRSSAPGGTLAWAHELLGRTDRARETLAAARARRPDDPLLLLDQASLLARTGEGEAAAALLEQAKGRVLPVVWNRTAAAVADATHDLERALALHREVVASAPLDVASHERIAALLEQRDGEQAAQQHCRELVARFPESARAHRLAAEWIPPGEGDAIVDALVALDPADGWAAREQALRHAGAGRRADADACLATARAIGPHLPAVDAVEAGVALQAGDRARVRRAARAALRLDADVGGCLPTYVRAWTRGSTRRRALTVALAELRRQYHGPPSLDAFASLARTLWTDTDCLAALEERKEQRPDLEASWSQLADQLTRMERFDEALAVVEAALDRFPHSDRLLWDLAWIHNGLKSPAAELEALERLHRVGPSVRFTLRLARCRRAASDEDGALQALEWARRTWPRAVEVESTIARGLLERGEPGSSDAVQGALDAILARASAPAQAIDALGDAVPAGPERAERGAAALEPLTRRHPDDPRPWLALADLRRGSDRTDDALTALEEACRLDPPLPEAFDRHAELLAARGELEAARALCCSSRFAEPPKLLRWRAAELALGAGDDDAAVQELRALVADAPRNVDGWDRAVNACRETSLGAYDALTAEFIVARPDVALAWGFRADAHHRADRPAESLDALGRALDLDPRYEYAGRALFHRLLVAGECQEAARVLETMGAYGWPPNELLAREVGLAARERDLARAHHAAARLAACATADEDDLGYAFDVLARADALLATAEALAPDWSSGAASEAAALALVRQALEREAWKVVERVLASLTPRPDAFAAVAREALAGLDRADKRTRVATLAKRFEAQLRSDPDCWLRVATTLSRDASPARALAWTADWNQRSDLSPRALLAAVALLRRAGRDREAATLSLRALGADPTADGVAEHRLWLLADRCGHPEGDLAPATEIRRDTVHGDLHRALHALLLAVHGWGSDAAPAPDAAARQLQGVVASYGTPLPRALQRLVWRAVGRAARSRGGPLGWVWVLSAAWKARRAAPA